MADEPSGLAPSLWTLAENVKKQDATASPLIMKHKE
jgi:hypothetical protein